MWPSGTVLLLSRRESNRPDNNACTAGQSWQLVHTSRKWIKVTFLTSLRSGLTSFHSDASMSCCHISAQQHVMRGCRCEQERHKRIFRRPASRAPHLHTSSEGYGLAYPSQLEQDVAIRHAAADHICDTNPTKPQSIATQSLTCVQLLGESVTCAEEWYLKTTRGSCPAGSFRASHLQRR